MPIAADHWAVPTLQQFIAPGLDMTAEPVIVNETQPTTHKQLMDSRRIQSMQKSLHPWQKVLAITAESPADSFAATSSASTELRADELSPVGVISECLL